ncbi:MAG TPA: 20S proteasome subunit A/B [Gammaproteobacteria bacterium]|nr:20S proteasome subunit A/B [Gammaproteobacteria bacterium]
MTYCLGITLNDGIVFAADTRTNAGVDYVTSYSKLHVFSPENDRLFVVLSAGNLATTQDVLNRLTRDLKADDGRESLRTVRYPFEAADYLGRVSVLAQSKHADALSRSNVSGETTLIIGGQIRGEPHGLFLVYPQGNYISASPETPYLQIGESKYGKPMLDRIIDSSLSLNDAARLSLVSLEATVRSNITVGPPFQLAIYPRDSFALARHVTIKENSRFYLAFKSAWQDGLKEAFAKLPRFEWETEGDKVTRIGDG